MSINHVVAAVALVVVAALPARAGVIFSDDFDTDSTRTHLNFNELINWTVSNGSIDYNRNGSYGIPCSGGCLDLDGSTRDAGRITSRATFTFDAGMTYFLEGLVSGSGRGGARDSVTFGFIDTVTLTEVTATFSGIVSSDPFTLLSQTWSGAGLGGTYRLFVEGAGGDNVGAILDGVALRAEAAVGAAVPEPASALLVGLGLLAAGASQRRRSAPSA